MIHCYCIVFTFVCCRCYSPRHIHISLDIDCLTNRVVQIGAETKWNVLVIMGPCSFIVVAKVEL